VELLKSRRRCRLRCSVRHINWTKKYNLVPRKEEREDQDPGNEVERNAALVMFPVFLR
jgi:hypothetical protein